MNGSSILQPVTDVHSRVFPLLDARPVQDSCKDEPQRPLRALDLSTMFAVARSFEMAAKIAHRYNQVALMERLNEVSQVRLGAVRTPPLD